MIHGSLRMIFPKLVSASLLLGGGCGSGIDANRPCNTLERHVVIPDGGLPDSSPPTGQDYPLAECEVLCRGLYAGELYRCIQTVVDGTPAVACNVVTNPCTGRRPAGFTLAADAETASELARYLGIAAELEAASVRAFAILGRELRAHGAPGRLVRAAARAARDEVRHAKMMSALHRRQQARPVRASAPLEQVAEPLPEVRSLEEVADENASEGCVRETFGALLATWQAWMAQHLPLRKAMRVIAKDETRHAELAWSVARWAEGRLPIGARRRVADRRGAAAEATLCELRAEPPAELVLLAGLPRRAQSEALFKGMLRACSLPVNHLQA